MRITLFTLLIAGLAEHATSQDQSRPLEVVPEIDVTRYMGIWYEIARLPNTFQEQCVGEVTATYTLLDDGDIEVLNQCRKADGTLSQAKGKAKRAGTDLPHSKLKVRFAPAWLSFLPFVWGNYWIIDLASDYSYAVIGEPDREYFWILSRTPTMEEGIFQQILDGAKSQGYDLSALIRTKQ